MKYQRHVTSLITVLSLTACQGPEQAALLSNDFGGPECDAQGAPFGGGNGTADSPFTICTVAQLQNVTSPNHTQHFLLAADLDASGVADWETLGQFSGVFDGGGHTISNLTHVGAFAGLWSSIAGTVKNLNVNTVAISGTGGQAVIAENTSSQGLIENVHIRGGTVNGGTGDRNGAIVSENYGTIRSCTSNVNVSGDDDVGGLVGANYGTIEGSDSSGTITGDLRLGRISGTTDSSSLIRDCSYSGFVSHAFQAIGLVNGTVVNCN